MPDLSPPPIANDLICLGADGIHLIASRELETGRVRFPARPESDARYERITLPNHGRLWSWTIQRFRPKTPPYAGLDEFEPYAVGYIELDGVLIVESRLTDVAFETLAIGMAMRLVPLLFAAADGLSSTTFAFAPAEGAAA
ncbi:Zn-ribbon domain-containing OB-fold protein [Sphingomonas sanxanigenens]|uniref:Zn-ribbon domain-containing OB-fold protein n=1 Tax=Sphingomonas sanxanigenens TaxID=397260 RepID=UPI00046C98D8|nr:OB-fold domain-containing protein [Sphingomonas sanxanigenens]